MITNIFVNENENQPLKLLDYGRKNDYQSERCGHRGHE